MLVRCRARPAQRRGTPHLSSRQSDQRLDPRGDQRLDRRAVHADLQQPRHVRSGGGTEHRRVDHSRPCRILVVERRQDRAVPHPAPQREVARWHGVHVERRRVHLQPADQPGAQSAADQPARCLVRQRQLRPGADRLRRDDPPQPAAAVAVAHAGIGLHADLSLPRSTGADARETGRYRTLQARNLQPVRPHPPGAQSRLLEARSPLSPAARRRC